jgi:hypothetical protein
MNRTYYSFDEQRNLWAQAIRNSPTGVAYLRLVDDPNLYEINVRRSTPGHLAWDMETLVQEFPEALEETDRLVEQNFQSDLFVSPEVIDRETHDRLHALLQPKLIVQNTPVESVPVVPEKEEKPVRKIDPFC